MTADENEGRNKKASDEGGWRKGAGARSGGRPVHRLRGGLILGLGGLLTLLLMANAEQLPHGPLYGILAMLLAAVGLVDLLGLFVRESADATPVGATIFGRAEGELEVLAPKYAVPVAACILLGGGLLAGYDGLPWVILAALLSLLPAATRRPGLLVFVVASLLYLPLLGAYGLWDPWETHYGEVAREILSRDDWISLWWAQENWFWSKPILIFWSEALSMGVLGVDFHPDANPAHPEWALRIPIFLMSLGALMSVYAAVARVFNQRAGVLAALVLATMPHFFFLTRQAITDVPFVANMVIAMCMLILAMREDPERQVRDYRIGRFVVSAQHVMIAALFLVVVPQALYLISRNVTMVSPVQYAWHADQFMMGSAGNMGVPGNATPRDMAPYANGLLAQPAVQGLVWLLGLGALLFMLRRERRAQGLYMFAFYLFCGLAFMGKGIPGFGLPGMVALLYLVASGRWSLLLEGRLRIAAGALTVAVVGLPWYVAMYIRHGPPFTDRLLVHDHINRLAAGVHGDNGSIEYFVEQLGYAMFPWVAIVPAALTMWLWYQKGVRQERARVAGPALGARDVGAAQARAEDDGDEASDGDAGDAADERTGEEPEASQPTAAPPLDDQEHRYQTTVLVTVWFAGAFTLFSAMITKFHHYIFPAVPPAAILTGLLLDRVLGPAPSGLGKRVGSVALAVVGPALLVMGFGGLWGDLRGVIPEGAEEPAEWVLRNGMGTALALALVALGLGALAGAWMLLRPGKDARAALADFYGRWEPSLAALLVGGAVIVAFVGRDMSWVTDARPQGYERLIHLFVYNYGRPWPESLDYRPIITGFAITATLLFAVAALRLLRPLAGRALIGLALVFTVWALDVYMIDLSPHWGQRELVKLYYEEREGPEQPLVAWQMNWKGENFYTGNRVAVFVKLDNAEIREWIAENRGRTAFFVMEHGRLNNFRTLVPGRELVEHTDERLNNKFVLVEVPL